MSVHVTGDRELLARLAAVGRVPASGILRRWQMRTTQLAKLKAPKRTGNLKRTIRPGWLRGTSATVEATAHYAGMVEGGTRPHIIVPRTARALAWGGDRRLSGSLRKGASPTRFARRVRHPGTKAQPFLHPSAQQALGELDTQPIIDAWNDGA